MLQTIIKRFDAIDEVRSFEKGKFEIVTIGRTTYQPGWVWTTHVGDYAA